MPEIIPNWHPIFVKFTIGLFSTAVLLYVAALAAGSGRAGQTLRLVARANLLLGVLFTVGTLLTGWHAYNTVAHDADSHKVMTNHRNWGLVTAVLFALLAVWCATLWWRGRGREGPAFVLAALVAAAPLTVTGYLGGELVYRHGVGVLSLPDTDDHDHHDHDHHNHDGHGNGHHDHDDHDHAH